MMTTRIALLTACPALLLGCTDLQRTNPLDPEMAVSIALSGPDTVTSTGEEFAVNVTITPDWPNAPVEWDYGSGLFGLAFLPTSRTFMVPPGYHWPDHWIVTVNAGPHEASLAIPFRQKVARVSFQPCPSNVCVMHLDGDDFAPAPAIGLRYWDAGNAPFARLDVIPASVLSTIVVRDESVAQKDLANSSFEWMLFQPVSQGKTYVVSTQFGSDSVAIYADYALHSLEASCPATIPVGETVPIPVTGKSAGGIPLIRPLVLTWNLRNDYENGEAEMTAAGSFKGITPGLVSIFGSEGNALFNCIIEIVP